jgi:hypothetical protein
MRERMYMSSAPMKSTHSENWLKGMPISIHGRRPLVRPTVKLVMIICLLREGERIIMALGGGRKVPVILHSMEIISV